MRFTQIGISHFMENLVYYGGTALINILVIVSGIILWKSATDWISYVALVFLAILFYFAEYCVIGGIYNFGPKKWYDNLPER